ENDPEFLKHLQTEFPRGADVYQDSGLSKREFMKLMGASFALAGVGLAGCRRPESYLVPFTKGVEFAIPGKFLYYATSMPARYGAVPLIATTADGRPTKLEGNPLHPFSNGGTDSFAQAEILNLYDPHRSKQITENGKASDAAAFDAFVQSLVNAKQDGVAILTEPKTSPTRDRLRAALESKFPNLLWAEYDPLAATATAEANEASFGPNTRLVPQFEKADIVLAIGSDFLNPIETGIGFAQGFAARRSPEQNGKSMNRLYAVENHFTVTGGMADHRLRCKASELGEFTRQLALALANQTNDANLAAVAKAFPESKADLNADWVKECAADLAANKGRSIVLAGPLTPAPLQTLVNAINNALGNIGSTLLAVKTDAVDAASIADLAAAINKGSVKNLFLLGVNPVQNAPADLDFAALLPKVANTVHLGLFEDETAKACRWHVPAAHFLESWG
ncbi:MAG: TAT-variant-translocated molybdopterin oxidoreductase, partial [Spartobacteria bacterium]